MLETTLTDPTIILDKFQSGSEMDLISFEVLHTDDQKILLQYQLHFVPPPYQALLASGNLPQFPYTIEDGWIVCELTTSHERLSQFRDELEETGFIFEVVWVTQSGDPVALLTDRQRELMSEAITLGYYDTPRQCSLTELAAELNVSKSTVSVVLHNAEEIIIKGFFSKSIDQKGSDGS